MNGHASVVQQQIEAHAAVNAVDAKVWTPLQYAAGRGHNSVLQKLIGAGAALNAVDARGRTALHLAAHFGQAAAVQLLQRWLLMILTL
jgi:ankyrin repeat protein